MPGNPNSTSDSRIGATAFTIGNKIYMGTGLQLLNNEGPKKDIFEYNISTDSWVQKQNIPVQRSFAISFTINGYGYLGSGDLATNHGGVGHVPEVASDFYRYDPSLDVWVIKASMEPTGRYGAVGFSINGKGYIAFGSRGSWGPNGRTEPLNSIREYDPNSGNAGAWVDKANAPEGFIYSNAFVLNNKAYIAGGVRVKTDPLNVETVSNTIEFNPSTNIWTAKASLPSVVNPTFPLTNNSRASAISFGLLDRGYLISGILWDDGAPSTNLCLGLGAFSNSASCIQKNTLKYNPYTNVWSQISNSNPFDPSQGIESAVFSQDDCGYGYATAGRISTGVNFKHFKFSDSPDADYIQGPSTICSNSTYNLQLSNSGTVTWTTSSNITIVSGQSTKNLTVTSSSNGAGWVQASINIGCRVVTFPQKPVWVGYAQIQDISYPSSSVAPYQLIPLSIVPVPNSNSNGYYKAVINRMGGGYSHTIYGNVIEFSLPMTGSYNVKVYANNACGWPQNFYPLTFFCTEQGGMFALYPNPADETLTVSFAEDTESTPTEVGPFKLVLVNKDQKEVFSTQTTSSKVVIPTEKLPTGEYYLNVVGPKKQYQKHVLIAH